MTLLFLLLFGLLNTAFAAEPQSAVVIVPVADVWSRPLAAGEKPSDELRETQVLFGERVLIHESSGSWVHIEAIEQPEFTHHNLWEGYPGWIFKSSLKLVDNAPEAEYVVSTKWLQIIGTEFPELPIGSLIHILKIIPYHGPQTKPVPSEIEFDLNNGRRGRSYLNRVRPRNKPGNSFAIQYAASTFIGDPYLWGGLSAFDETHKIPLKGVDCSGLVHLAYRVDGMTIPRDSHEQWMKAKPIKRADLKPADLIFSAKADNPKKITHVALYEGDGQIIEAPQTGMAVREISFKEKYGKDLEKVESGDTVGERVVYFGSFLQK